MKFVLLNTNITGLRSVDQLEKIFEKSSIITKKNFAYVWMKKIQKECIKNKMQCAACDRGCAAGVEIYRAHLSADSVRF